MEVASAKGISVNFSTGDGGDNGVGSPVGSPGVPSVAPHATAVGGTTILNDLKHPRATITTGWGDTVTFLESGGVVLDPPALLGLIGGSGGGESVYWPKPSWQSALPGKGRQTPDVSALSDPYSGVPMVITVGTTQQIRCGWGSTSLGYPIFSAFWALANEKAGSPLGQAAPRLAPLSYGSLQDVLPPVTARRITTMAASLTPAARPLTQLRNCSALHCSATRVHQHNLSRFRRLCGFRIRHRQLPHGQKGWDNATGFGTPYGMTFLNAVAP